MEWKNLMRPRVLIVEDIPEQLEAIANFLAHMPGDSAELGIDRFDTYPASSVVEAEQQLSESGDDPFDLLLLDLGIPIRAGEPEIAENGQRLLDKVRREGLVKEVIVVSIWYVVDHVARAFQNGAVDFIAKPYTKEVLQAQVIKCWKQLLRKESTSLLGEHRISDLVPYAEKGLAHRFTTSFSNVVRAVSHDSEDIERYMRERYRLDRTKDAQDFFFACLNSQEEFIKKAKQEWSALKAPLQSADESSSNAAVETLLREIHKSLLPCLIVKNVELDFVDEGANEILTFEEDVKAVLKEIIAGAANTLQDFDGDKHPLKIKVENADTHVRITCTDYLQPIEPEDAKQISDGSSISPLRRFSREWGLSVVQHIAMRGGGRLEIEPQSHGNIINYFVPSAQ